MQAPQITVTGLTAMPEVRQGDDISRLILDAAGRQKLAFAPGDVLVVTQKVVSKAEGRVVDLDAVDPSPFARAIAADWNRDPRVVEVVLRESRRVVRMDRGVLICETHHGFVCANAGVDASNVGRTGRVTLLPLDPDASAEEIRRRVSEAAAAHIAVIISDTFGRPWREGHVNFAIGVAGMEPLQDYAGRTDPAGYELRLTKIALADELAAAAELAMGKLDRVPAAVIRGIDYPRGLGTGRSLLRDAERDMFR